MEKMKFSEYWKRVTCIMMIYAGYKNADTISATQCSVNTAKAVRRNNEDYEAGVNRKGHTTSVLTASASWNSFNN